MSLSRKLIERLPLNVLKVYLDASVIIAALLSPKGGSAKLIKNTKVFNFTSIISQTVVDELVAKKEKIKKSEEEISQFISKNKILVRKSISLSEIKSLEGLIDRDDARLIAGARLTKCRYLVTLDKKHLLRPDIKKHFRDIKILTPGEMLAILAE